MLTKFTDAVLREEGNSSCNGLNGYYDPCVQQGKALKRNLKNGKKFTSQFFSEIHNMLGEV